MIKISLQDKRHFWAMMPKDAAIFKKEHKSHYFMTTEYFFIDGNILYVLPIKTEMREKGDTQKEHAEKEKDIEGFLKKRAWAIIPAEYELPYAECECYN